MGIRNGQIPVTEKAYPYSGVLTFSEAGKRKSRKNLNNVLIIFNYLPNSPLQCQKVHFTGLFRVA